MVTHETLRSSYKSYMFLYISRRASGRSVTALKTVSS